MEGKMILEEEKLKEVSGGTLLKARCIKCGQKSTGLRKGLCQKCYEIESKKGK